MAEQSSLERRSQGAQSDFRLATPEFLLQTQGLRQILPQGPLASLAKRTTDFFSRCGEGPALLVGALPFDVEGDDHLFQPERIGGSEQIAAAEQAVFGRHWLVEPEPSAAGYAAAVANCLAVLKAEGGVTDGLSKAVLSRSLRLESDQPISVASLLRRLSIDPSVTVFKTPLPEQAGLAPVMIGATPELLVSKKGDQVVSHPLAGSARRSSDPSADRQAGRDLLNSEKDQREHRAVTEAIFDVLSPYCMELGAPDGTTLRATATMLHLGTRIVGRLKDRDTPVGDLLRLLHPTPAVCGMPRRRAADAIRSLETYDRGFYAGAVGWIDARQDGEWYVSIRCAEVAGRRARVFAGAGIVLGSDPQKETEETSAKFQAMLNAFGIDEHGRPFQENAA